MATGLGVFGNLPIEIVQHIATFWSKEEAYTCAQTSKKLNELLCNFKIFQYSEFWQKIQQGMDKYFSPTPLFNTTQLLRGISFQKDPMHLDVAHPRQILSSMIPTDQTNLKIIENKAKLMARLFVTRTGCPIKWLDEGVGQTHYFSMVQRLSPYPCYDSSGLFANYEMEQREAKIKCFLVPTEKQASLCVGELFYLLSANRRDFSFEESLLFNGKKWSLLEYEIAGAICARLIDPIDSSKFTQFFNKIDKESQETVIVKAARALTMGYSKAPPQRGEIDERDLIILPNFGLFTFFLKGINFKTRLPETQLALVKTLIRANFLEALSALEDMQEGPAKNAARVEMIYHFWRVLLADTALPIEQQGRNFAKLIKEAEDIPEEVLHKKVGRVLFQYLTLLANQPPPLLNFGESDVYIALLPRWGDENLCRNDALSILGYKMVELFESGLAPIPTHEEIFEFFREGMIIDHPITTDILLPMYPAFFPYFTTEEIALQALDFILSPVLDDTHGCGHVIKNLAKNWHKCPPQVRNSSKCLLKMADIIGGTNGYKKEKRIKYLETDPSSHPFSKVNAFELEEEGIEALLDVGLKEAREAEVLVRMLQLAKQAKMIDFYPTFLSRFKDFSESEEFKKELVSFLLMTDISTKVSLYYPLRKDEREARLRKLSSYWRLLFKELGKEEGLKYVRRIQNPQERSRALLGIIKNLKGLIEDQIFSSDDFVQITEEWKETL